MFICNRQSFFPPFFSVFLGGGGNVLRLVRTFTTSALSSHPRWACALLVLVLISDEAPTPSRKPCITGSNYWSRLFFFFSFFLLFGHRSFPLVPDTLPVKIPQMCDNCPPKPPFGRHLYQSVYPPNPVSLYTYHGKTRDQNKQTSYMSERFINISSFFSLHFVHDDRLCT